MRSAAAQIRLGANGAAQRHAMAATAASIMQCMIRKIRSADGVFDRQINFTNHSRQVTWLSSLQQRPRRQACARLDRPLRVIRVGEASGTRRRQSMGVNGAVGGDAIGLRDENIEFIVLKSTLRSLVSSHRSTSEVARGH